MDFTSAETYAQSRQIQMFYLNSIQYQHHILPPEKKNGKEAMQNAYANKLFAHLDALKKNAGLKTDAELAKCVGVEKRTLDKWKQNGKIPDGPFKRILMSLECGALELSPEDYQELIHSILHPKEAATSYFAPTKTFLDLENFLYKYGFTVAALCSFLGRNRTWFPKSYVDETHAAGTLLPPSVIILTGLCDYAIDHNWETPFCYYNKYYKGRKIRLME